MSWERSHKHIAYLSVLCLVCGLISIDFLHLAVRQKSHPSENALIPNDANPQFSETSFLRECPSSLEVLSREDRLAWIGRQLQSFGVEVQHHHFHANGYDGVNLVGYLRPDQSEGLESIVVSVASGLEHRIDGSAPGTEESVCLGIALLGYFVRVSWLAKDVIFVYSDDFPFKGAGLLGWLRSYLREGTTWDDDTVSYSGTIRGALHLALPPSAAGKGKLGWKGLALIKEGINGELPNMDLITSMSRIMYQQHGFLPRVSNSTSEALSTKRMTMYSQLAALANFEPSGHHAHFLAYGISAVTITATGKGEAVTGRSVGRLVEGTIRCLNNIVQKLHRSYFQYLMTHPFLFVPIQDYLIPWAIMMFPVPLLAISIITSQASRDMLSASLHFHGSQLVAVAAGFVLYRYPQWLCKEFLDNGLSASAVAIWHIALISSLAIFLAAYFSIRKICNGVGYTVPGARGSAGTVREDPQWIITRAWLLAVLTLCMISSVLNNYSVGLLFSLVSIPVHMLAVPGGSLRSFAQCVIVLGAFSPCSLTLAFSSLNGISSLGEGLGAIMKGHAYYGSVPYFTICMMHTPLWLQAVGIVVEAFMTGPREIPVTNGIKKTS